MIPNAGSAPVDPAFKFTHAGMTSSREINKAPKTSPKEIEICVLSDKVFTIIHLNLGNHKKPNVDNEIRKTIHKQNEKFNKEIEAIKG